MGPIARLNRRVRRACLRYLPDLHTPAEDAAFFQNRVFPSCHVWLAEAEGNLVGFIAMNGQWLDHLYVEPAWQGRGVGSALLAEAKKSCAALELWTFQRNEQARRFYERHGFVLVELTDGSGNEEKEPDARYRWPGD